MSLKEIKEKVEASSEFANTRESVTTDLSPEDQAELDEALNPEWTKEDLEKMNAMAQLMAYYNPKARNSQRRNVRKKNKN